MKKYWITTTEGEREITITAKNSAVAVGLGDAPQNFSVQSAGTLRWLVRDGDKTHEVLAHRNGNSFQAWVDGEFVRFDVQDERARRRQMITGGKSAHAGDLVAPMPGRVVKVTVSVGQKVKAGDPVAILEAMKMENEFKAPKDGTVTVVKVKAGDTVEAGAILAVVE